MLSPNPIEMACSHAPSHVVIHKLCFREVSHDFNRGQRTEEPYHFDRVIGFTLRKAVETAQELFCASVPTAGTVGCVPDLFRTTCGDCGNQKCVTGVINAN